MFPVFRAALAVTAILVLASSQGLACERAEPRVEAAFIEATHAVQLLGHPFPAGVRLCAVADLPVAAYTLPGEVLVSPRWAAQVSSDAVRFVLAHELGHQLQYAGLLAIYESGTPLSWTREYLADSLATKALAASGYGGLLSAVREAFESFDIAADALSDTHPPLRDRLAALRQP